MGKYEDAILDFFKKQKDETKVDYIIKVANEILDVSEMIIALKDGREFVWNVEEGRNERA